MIKKELHERDKCAVCGVGEEELITEGISRKEWENHVEFTIKKGNKFTLDDLFDMEEDIFSSAPQFENFEALYIAKHDIRILISPKTLTKGAAKEREK